MPTQAAYMAPAAAAMKAETQKHEDPVVGHVVSHELGAHVIVADGFQNRADA